MRFLVVLLSVLAFASPAFVNSVLAQKAGVPPVDLYKIMAGSNKPAGWVAFRNFDGKQLIYFTPIVSLHCGLSEVRYSLNSSALDQTFALPECNPALPFSMPPDADLSTIALSQELGSVTKVTIQIVYSDDSESEVLVYEPCPTAGNSTCAKLTDG